MIERFEDQARAAMQEAGFDPGPVIADDRYHRFSTSERHGDDAGWYRFAKDHKGLFGAFGDFRQDISQKFHVFDPVLPKATVRNMLAGAEKRMREAGAERQRGATEHATALLKAADPARPNHPYLTRKQVGPNGLKELCDREVTRVLGYCPKRGGEPLRGRILLAPVYAAGTLRSVEMIDEDGRKSALFGGSKRGAYWSPASVAGAAILGFAEGVATAKSIAEQGGIACVSVCSCGNFAAVLEAARLNLPFARLVVFADLGNGLEVAKKAAERVDAILVAPPADIEGTDFNDFAVERGGAVVYDYIQRAVAAVGRVRFADSTTRPHLEYALPGLQLGTVGMLAGQGAIGKSFLALELLLAVAKRWPAGGQGSPLAPAVAGKCGVLFGEDDMPVLQDRMHTLIRRYQLSDADLAELDQAIEIRSTVMQDMNIQQFDHNKAADGPFLPEFYRFCYGKRLAIVDPLVLMHDADERDNTQMGRVMAIIKTVARTTNCAILILHHVSKGNGERESWAAARGASVVSTSLRWQLTMTPPSKEEAALYHIEDRRTRYVRCEFTKISYGPPMDDFWMYREPDGTLSFTVLHESEAAAPAQPPAAMPGRRPRGVAYPSCQPA